MGGTGDDAGKRRPCAAMASCRYCDSAMRVPLLGLRAAEGRRGGLVWQIRPTVETVIPPSPIWQISHYQNMLGKFGRQQIIIITK